MTGTPGKPIPEGMHTVTPHLTCAGAADAIDFYKNAFDASEQSRLPGPNGKLMHASLRIGDSTVMLTDEMPEWGLLGRRRSAALRSRSISMSTTSTLSSRAPSLRARR
jgi:PhnB protein